jgi:trimethylamine:corrinoid methyltransferase-like protein
VQVLLDFDFTEGLKLLEPPPVTDATLGLEAILELGFGFKEDYMGHPHTVEHMRSAAWMPPSFSRNGWGADLEQEHLAKARERAAELIAGHRQPEGREAALVKIDAVIEKAKQELLS